MQLISFPVPKKFLMEIPVSPGFASDDKVQDTGPPEPFFELKEKSYTENPAICTSCFSKFNWNPGWYRSPEDGRTYLKIPVESLKTVENILGMIGSLVNS